MGIGKSKEREGGRGGPFKKGVFQSALSSGMGMEEKAQKRQVGLLGDGIWGGRKKKNEPWKVTSSTERTGGAWTENILKRKGKV